MPKGHNKYKDTPDDHDYMTPEHVAGFLRNHGTGTDNMGRRYLASIVGQYDNPTVVDAACGPCVNWEVFKMMGVECQYCGMDRCENFLTYASKQYPEINLVNGYVQEMPFADESVDVVVMRHIFEHLQDGYEAAIREGLRVASKELVLVFFLDLSDSEEDNISESKPDENGCTYFWNTYSQPKLMHFLAEFGYQIKGQYVRTPGAAAADTIIRIVK